MACCPPNAARLLASMERHLYARSEADRTLYVNQFVGSHVETSLGDDSLSFTQSAEFPWEGEATVEFTHDDPVEFELRVRVPEWADTAEVTVNDESVDPRRSDGYACLDREWGEGDHVRFSFPLPIEAVAAHPRVRENAGRVALRRGPLVYCLEQTDHSVPVETVSVDGAGSLDSEHKPGLLGGVTVLRGDGVSSADEWEGALYRPRSTVETTSTDVVAIPYYAWDNREPGAMTVWIPSA